jgi:hypothetical protein
VVPPPEAPEGVALVAGFAIEPKAPIAACAAFVKQLMLHCTIKLDSGAAFWNCAVQHIQRIELMTRTTKTKQDSVKSFAADVQAKAKTAYAKGAVVAGEIGTMSKGNVQAVVASGKILGAGLKGLGEGTVAEGKQTFGTFLADLKALSATKSPTEFFKLQVQLAKRNADVALALGSRNGKALGKLAADAAAPISGQVKANLGKLRAAA